MRIFIALLSLFLCCLSISPTVAAADTAALPAGVLTQLASDDSDEKIAAIQSLAQTADPAAVGVLQALADGTLNGPDGSSIMINNRVRGAIEGALAALKLFDPNVKVRLASAREIASSADVAMVPMLDKALARESDAKVKAFLTEARALALLGSAEMAEIGRAHV